MNQALMCLIIYKEKSRNRNNKQLYYLPNRKMYEYYVNSSKTIDVLNKKCYGKIHLWNLITRILH